MRGLITWAVLVPLATGCGFYFGDDDDCNFGGSGSNSSGAPADPGPEFRDPQTGQCQLFGGSGVIGDPCDPRPLEEADREPSADPDWGLCNSQCTGLDENTCLATPACRAVYQLDDSDFDPATAPYVDCWATAPSGPVQGGDCTALDAYQCSRHDDCVAYHATEFGCDAPEGADCAPEARLGGFSSCGAEPDGDDPLPTACDQLIEDACISRLDCTPLYEGIDCTCQGELCDCASWIFDVCSTS